MSNILGIILGISLFMFLVIIHELGHFFAAKKSGAKVLEFGIGIPPKLFKVYTDKSGTEYTINALPLGGFVRIKGEDPTEPDVFFAKDSFVTQTFWKKMLILFAGVGMNLIFAFVALVTVFWIGVEPIQVIPQNMIEFESKSYLMATTDFLQEQGFLKYDKLEAKVDAVFEGQIASEIGLEQGDIIIDIDGQKVDLSNLTTTLFEMKGKEFELAYRRGENLETVSTDCPEDSCFLGISLDSNVDVDKIKFGFGGAVKAAFSEIGAEAKLTMNALGRIGSSLVSFNKDKTQDALSKMSGPVGAIKVGQGILEDMSWVEFLAFGAMISLALAFFNMLPIPALDGGRALGVLIQSLFRLKPEKYFVIENYLNITVFVLLMGLGVYVILMDLSRFWGVHVFGFGG